jgi:hypothetical protein
VSDLVVAGSGMAGLAAAATAGAEVWEKGDRAGGSMLLSSGVVWRYRDWEEFRRQCPRGDPDLQQTIHEHVDEAIAWLETLGAEVIQHSTGNPLTVGKRFDPGSLLAALSARVPSLRLRSALDALPPDRPVVLATGGFQASAELVANHIGKGAASMPLRSNPWSAGDGLRLGLGGGGALSDGMDQFYGRAMPVAAGPDDWIRSAQVYARHARVVNDDGEEYDGPVGWAEVEVVQWLARQPGARGWFVVGSDALGETTRYGTVGSLVERARGLGSRVERRGEAVAVEVVAAITQTLGGLRVDARGRVLDSRGETVDGLWAAGGDIGGVATGGYMSNLAAALVLGRIAAQDAMS